MMKKKKKKFDLSKQNLSSQLSFFDIENTQIREFFFVGLIRRKSKGEKGGGGRWIDNIEPAKSWFDGESRSLFYF